MLWFIISALGIWFIFEMIVRVIAEKGLETDFYGSIQRQDVRDFQSLFGVKVFNGGSWYHLGWIADPENETYQIRLKDKNGKWQVIDQVWTGSWLNECQDQFGDIQIVAVSKISGKTRVIGEESLRIDPSRNAQTEKKPASPRICGPWSSLFRPEKTGSYINDHCVFQDNQGNWRLLGITAFGNGDYDQEKYFACGVSEEFPPIERFNEIDPIADFGEVAWAPDVIQDQNDFHLFWSPHQLHHMVSKDGVNWTNHEIVLEKPFHRFFRDAMIFQVAPDQWLLYATGRGKWFSRIDIYQSFDLVHWQYIRPALESGWGAEKNFVTGSMESPFLIHHHGQYYLSTTYNNESFFLAPLLLQFKIFLKRKAYNNTLIFRSQNPYNFGVYRGKKRTHNFQTTLEAHAPVYIEHQGKWFITTCGWPFAATLTNGEAAWAPLDWDSE